MARVILLAEASAVMEPYLDQRDRFGADVLALLDQGRLVPATDYINAQRLRRSMQREFAALWSRVDCLFTPTTPITAPRIGETTLRLAARVRTCAWRPRGWCALSTCWACRRFRFPAAQTAAACPSACRSWALRSPKPCILRVAQALVPAEVPVPRI